MVWAAASIVAGLALLFFGGEALVRGAVSLAARFSVPQFVIGLTIVGFGTSMPEMVVSADAALRGVPDIAMGNVVGSNIANVLLILGLSALIMPIAAHLRGLGRDLSVMMAAVVLLQGLALSGGISRLSGLFLVAALGAYILHTFLAGRKQARAGGVALEPVNRMSLRGELTALAFGLAALVIGADLLVEGATEVARDLGVSDAVIGLTIVAIGTSLPELATSLVAALRHQSGVALGNIIGSNIFNVLGILGVTAVIASLSVSPEMARYDIPVMIAVQLALVACIVLLGRLSRLVGAGFLAGYAAYIASLF